MPTHGRGRNAQPSDGQLKHWEWTPKRRMAALLFARGELTWDEIARRVPACLQRLSAWRKRPEFQEYMEELRERLGEEAVRFEIGIQQRRLKELNQRWLAMQTIIAERAARHRAEREAGDTTIPLEALTGLQVRRKRLIGRGPTAREVDEWVVDTALLQEMRDMEKQAAVEAGQWVERSKVDERVKKTVRVTVTADVPAAVANLTAGDLEVIRVLRERLAAAGRSAGQPDAGGAASLPGAPGRGLLPGPS